MILRSLARNLVVGARLALFLPVRPHDYRVTPADYAALVAFNFLVWVAAAWVRAGFQGEFDVLAIPIYLGGVPLVLLVALVAARAASSPERLLLVATALTASDAVIELISLALPWVSEDFLPFAALAQLAWIWLVTLRAVAVAAGTRLWPFVQGAAAATALVVSGLLGYPRSDVWLAPDADPEAEPASEGRTIQSHLLPESKTS